MQKKLAKIKSLNYAILLEHILVNYANKYKNNRKKYKLIAIKIMFLLYNIF